MYILHTYADRIVGATFLTLPTPLAAWLAWNAMQSIYVCACGMQC